jgi:hypothetical protein
LLACLFAAGDLRQPEHPGTSALTTIGAIRATLDGPERRATVDIRPATFFDAMKAYLLQTGAAIVSGWQPCAAIAWDDGRPHGEMETGIQVPVVERVQITALGWRVATGRLTGIRRSAPRAPGPAGG